MDISGSLPFLSLQLISYFAIHQLNGLLEACLSDASFDCLLTILLGWYACRGIAQEGDGRLDYIEEKPECLRLPITEVMTSA